MAIVGAGVTGLSVAFHLRQRGLRPLVLERSGVAAGASGVQPGGVRQQWGTRVNCRLARESLAFHRASQELLDASVELGFRACGYLFLAHSDDSLRQLVANVALQNDESVPSRIVTPAEAAELVPGLDAATVAGAAWCAEDGYYDRPQAMIQALARDTDIELAEVRSLDPTGAGWTLELARGGSVAAEQVVVAAACDSRALVEPLGVELPVEAESRWLFLGEPIRERLLDPLVVSAELGFAAKQLGDGRLLASDLSATTEVGNAVAVQLAAVRRAIGTLLPRLQYVDFGLHVHGVYDVTPDRQAVIGRLPGHEGLWVAAGFSGHGFMLAPAIGRILADAITGAAEDEALRVLDAARFAEGRLVPEPQVV